MKTCYILLLYILLELKAAFHAQNSALFVQSSETVLVDSSETYRWKTGSWGACDTHTRCGEGQKTRRVSCLNSIDSVVSNSHCKSYLRPSTIEPCFTVCDHHKYELRWRVGDWSPCIAQTINHCNGDFSSGIAHRNVECVLSSTNLVVDNEACEYFWDKPEHEMFCSVDCPQPCIIAKRNITCHVQECYELISWIEEVDDVIVAPSIGSMKCPRFSSEPVCKKHKVTKCKNLTQGRNRYRTKISSWSPCTFGITALNKVEMEVQDSLHPVIGFSKRNITCIDEDGNEVDMSFCNLSVTPPLLRQCVVPVDCKVSPWSEWNVQEEGCIASDGRVFPEIRTRERKLVRLPVGLDAKPCPPLFEKIIISTELPRCYKYQWFPMEWSDCQIVLHGNHGEVTILKPTCSNGLQYRNLTCLRMRDKVPVDDDLCKNPRPSTVQRCKVPCKRDCKVSHWAKWGPCMTYNMSNFRDYSEEGYRRRVRSVLVSPTNGGTSCPHLEEVDPCKKIDILGWQYGNWSECTTLDSKATCGPGKKTRDTTCMKWNGRPMDDYWCDLHSLKEFLEDTCYNPCPNDCIMSEWSDWSECDRECWKEETKEKKRIEGQMYSNRTILAIAGEGGKICRKKTRRSEYCNNFNCEVHKWTTSEWGPCFLPETNDVNDRFCGVGVQNRNVTCRIGEKEALSRKMCKFMRKPDDKRECHIPCTVDCVVSNFTDWTPCDWSCDSDAVQYRHRLILHESRYGGKPCPKALVEARPCPSSIDPHCMKHLHKRSENDVYSWDISKWSECQLPLEKQACGMGFQIRNVTCRNVAANRTVEPHFCLPSNWTLPDGPIVDVPTGFRSCEVFCSSNCAVSAWSTWTQCSYSYDAKRARGRELVGIGEFFEECQIKVGLSEESSCPIIPFNLAISTQNLWMSCIVENKNPTLITRNGQEVFHDCGRGYRYKFGVEFKSDKVVMPGVERDMCWIDCPIDCQMSDWSKWTECDVPCGQGFRERNRRVLVEGNELGRPCPKTVNKTEIQRDVCNIVCMDYHWHVGGWTNCMLKEVIRVWNNSECGSGTHYRSVRCFDKRTEKEVHESRCDPFLKPRSVEPCRVYCPGECVVSEWNISKKCTEPCTNDNFQELTRKILRLPNATAEPCPPLVEREPCILNSTCHNHNWVVGPWGSCMVPKGAYCGEGVQRRPRICLRTDGRQVDPIQCEKIHKSPFLEEPLSKPCYLDCPVDCVMSQWSPWDKSSCRACGPIGVMIRKRHILQPPSDAGQPCPAEFEQQKPCEYKPCYHWKHTEWSECDLEGAECGYGVRRRVVECVRFDFLKVDKAHCLVVNITFATNKWIDPAWLTLAQENSHEEEPCHVPCPGDCVISEWSTWSHCQKNCKIRQEVGYQTSSRHILFSGSQNSEPCSKQLWRTRPCWSDDCDIFAWKLRNSSYICERKDGLVVKGGCSSEPQPCFENCEELGGICEISNGTCYCENENDERRIMGPTSSRCIRREPRPPANHSAPTSEIKLKYYPDDSKVSFWMYAMISVGTAFIIFVAVTVYLMCRSSLRQRTVSVERQPSVRRRLTGAINDQSTMESNPDARPHFAL